MKKTMLTGIALAAATLALPAVARANDTAATAHFLPVGGAYYTFVDFIGNPDPQAGPTVAWFAVNLTARRSYDAAAFTVWQDANVDPPLDVTWFAADGTSTPAGVLTTTEGEPKVSGSTHAGDNDTFIPSASGTYLIRVSNLSTTDPSFFIITVNETTLFSPYYAVATAASYDAAPQVKNNTGETVTVYFTAFDTSGNPLPGCPTTGISLPPNGMTTFGVSSMCGTTSAFGGAQVAHTGRLGAVSANITTFSSASGLSFDAEFKVRDGMLQNGVWY